MAAVDPLIWSGAVAVSKHEPAERNAFQRMLYSRRDAHLHDGEAGEEGEEGGEGGADEMLAEGGEEEGEEGGAAEPPAHEGLRAADFGFESCVARWSDYLQAELHPRSLAPLRAHTHDFSELAVWPDGEAALARDDAHLDAGGPALLERVRRFLEEADTAQGFHLALDADGGFGGLATSLLTRIRDEQSRAPCLVLATATGSPGASAEPWLGALNGALGLTAFADLRASYVPLWGAEAPAALAELRIDPSLRYHTSAPLATWLDAISLTYRARSPRGGLANLLAGLHTRPANPLAAAALALPFTPPPARADARAPRAPAAAAGMEFIGCAPMQRAPHACAAVAQSASWLGTRRADAPLALAAALPCQCAADTAIWCRPQPLALPISYPQFFAPHIGADGHRVAEGTERADGEEVLSAPVGAALQSTPALAPLVLGAAAEWRAHRRAATRRLDGRVAADDLEEVSEALLALAEEYAEGSEDEDGAEMEMEVEEMAGAASGLRLAT